MYGAVMIGVLFAAEDARHETYSDTIIASLIVLVLYWALSLYTHMLGDRLLTQESLSLDLIGRGCLHEIPIVEGAAGPVIVLAIAWAAGAPLTRGLRLATFATAISIVVLEIAAAWRVRPHGIAFWLRVAGGAVIGLAVVTLKVVLHG